MNARRAIPWLAALMVAAMVGAQVLAQEISTGNLEGKVKDEKGTPVPGATITVTGPQGTRAVRSEPDGSYRFPFLPVGKYEIKVEMPGFATIVVKEVEILLNRRTNMPLQLSAGQVQTVTVTAQAPLIDMKQTSIGANVKVGEFINYLPIGRSYSDTFATVPGVVSGGGTGAGNYSISGASGLENQYIVDGVNITNTGYGGIGSYNIIYGSLGTGVTTDFLDTVQVKSGGFEAEFGGATGGVLNTIVKSGGNNLSGSVNFFFSPHSFQADAKTISLSTGAVNFVDEQREDLGLTLSGPIVKDKAFFFVAYNPVRTKTRMSVEPALFDSDFVPTTGPFAGVKTFPAASLGPQERERRNQNWAVKLSYYLTPNHRFELTGFGDPSHGIRGPQNPAALRYLDYQQGGGQSEIRYGGNNYALKYNAVFNPSFFGEFEVSRHDAKFRETPDLDENRVRDRRQQLCYLFPLFRCPPGVTADAPTTWFTGGTGFVSNANDKNTQYSASLTNVLPGNVELKYGVQYSDIGYEDRQGYSGAPIDFFIPADQDGIDNNGDGTLIDPGEGVFVKSTSGALIDERSPTNFRVTRNRLNPFPGPTKTKDLNGFIQATWSITPRITFKPGVRITKQKIEGSGTNFFLPFDTSTRTASNLSTCGASGTDVCESGFTPESYTFKTEYAPRLGATWDINGDGRSKLYGSLARYYERIPNDLAIRSLSTEISTVRYQFNGLDTTTNTPTNPDPATNPGSTILFNGLDATTVLKGTRLPYQDEAVIGYAYQIQPNLSIEVRGIYRKQGRVLEDVQFAKNEQIENLYYGFAAGYPFDPFGGSPSQPKSKTFPALPFSAYHLSNPGDNTAGPIKQFLEEKGLPASVAFDFPKPVHDYKALEVLVDKRLSDHWLFRANYRYSLVKGNYEGTFRNDNGQSDPNITSLFDFPNSPTMRGQFQVGPLNNDRPHVLNVYGAYIWNNGLSVGGSFNWQSGIPRTPLLAHPNYQNAGEIPGLDPIYFWWDDTDGDSKPDTFKTGPAKQFFNDPQSVFVTPQLFNYQDCPRGCFGRTPNEVTVNTHIGYDWKIKDSTLDLGFDVFNIFNTQTVLGFDDFVEATAGIPEVDFKRVANNNLILNNFQRPRSYRFTARWQF